MQQERDDLDRIVLESIDDIKVSDNYNYQLLSRISAKKQIKKQSYTFAFSLILAGFLIMFTYTSDIRYKIIDLQCRIKTNLNVMQTSNNSFISNFLGK